MKISPEEKKLREFRKWYRHRSWRVMADVPTFEQAYLDGEIIRLETDGDGSLVSVQTVKRKT